MTFAHFTRSLLFSLLLFSPILASAAEVKNVQLYQDGNKAVFTYDLVGDENRDQVKLTLTVGGQDYPQDRLHLAGDIGSVPTGKGKKIVWYVLQDFPRGVGGQMRWVLVGSGVEHRVEAGGRNRGGADFTDQVTGMEFVLVKGGCFQMGSNEGDNDEKPLHEVCVDDFYIGKYEVTNAEYRNLIPFHNSGKNIEKILFFSSSYNLNGEHQPVVRVSWDDTHKYITKLNSNSRSSKSYRLPTEAEWEYAARSGGKKEKWAGTDNGSSLGDYAWYDSNSGNKSHPVGGKQPNGLGLYDMSGNVWEWCADRYDSGYYNQSPRKNPYGPYFSRNLTSRVNRGGSWSSGTGSLRSTSRDNDGPRMRYRNLGFRLVSSMVQ